MYTHNTPNILSRCFSFLHLVSGVLTFFCVRIPMWAIWVAKWTQTFEQYIFSWWIVVAHSQPQRICSLCVFCAHLVYQLFGTQFMRVCTILSVVPNGFPFCEIHYSQYMHYDRSSHEKLFELSTIDSLRYTKIKKKKSNVQMCWSYAGQKPALTRAQLPLLFGQRTKRNFRQMLIAFCIIIIIFLNWVFYWCRSWLIPGLQRRHPWDESIHHIKIHLQFDFVCFVCLSVFSLPCFFFMCWSCAQSEVFQSFHFLFVLFRSQFYSEAVYFMVFQHWNVAVERLLFHCAVLKLGIFTAFYNGIDAVLLESMQRILNRELRQSKFIYEITKKKRF